MSFSAAPTLPVDGYKRCPHLGLGDDSATALGYPSGWNYCHSVRPIVSPKQEHQREFCLTPRHAKCPVFDAGGKKPLPKELRMRKIGATRKLIGRWIIFAVVLTTLIIGGLILSGYWAPFGDEKTSIPTWISRFIPQKTITITPPVIIETATATAVLETETVTPVKITISSTPVPSGEEIAATQTELALASRCAYPLDNPFGSTDRQFLLHRVVEGENITILTERYETTPEAIEAVNYFFPSSLWAELVIVIPLKMSNISGLPSFKPVLLDEEDISFEELAKDLLVSSAELIEFNQIDPSCRSFHGWVIVPADKINP
jgi:hypothetical protein